MSRHALGLAALVGVGGAAHFVRPASFDAIVPRVLPGAPRLWTQLSGAAELGVAAAIAVPRTRRLGGLAAAALFVCVFPANVQMAMDWSDRPPRERALAYGRLPLQLPLICWALRIRREAS